MSLKIQAKLSERFGSRIENSYIRGQDLVIMEDVPAEMKFEVSQGFMEHETQQKNYLPYFHMIGQIKEIKGQFPFNVSSLYFSESDSALLIKDVIYYPSPEELAHIIQTGKFYSRYFTVPPILSANTYSLPCRVNLAVVPPYDQAQYEANMFAHFTDLADEDKTNLPIFYVAVTGTGVTKRNDRLLDYYGIDLPEAMNQFVLTAESSGYTDPPLLEYMPEPVVNRESQLNPEDLYVAPEDEDELIQSSEDRIAAIEREAEQQVQVDVEPDFRMATPEDALIAQTDRAIVRTMEKKFDGKPMSIAAAREHAKKARSSEEQPRPRQEDISAVRQSAEQPPVESGPIGGAKPQPFQAGVPQGPRQPVRPAQPSPAVQAESEGFIGDDDPVPSTPEQAADAKLTAKERAKAERDRVMARVNSIRNRTSSVAGNGQAPRPQAEAGERTGPDDSSGKPRQAMDLEGMAGGDVADARLQAKVDEAHARENAQKGVDHHQAMQQAQAEEAAAKAGRAGIRTDRTPDQMQQSADVRMDLNPEANAAVEAAREEAAKQSEMNDRSRMEDRQGGDVSDASEQVKVDEAHARENAQKGVDALRSSEAQDRGREVSRSVQDMADAAGGKDGQEPVVTDEDEFI